MIAIAKWFIIGVAIGHIEKEINNRKQVSYNFKEWTAKRNEKR